MTGMIQRRITTKNSRTNTVATGSGKKLPVVCLVHDFCRTLPALQTVLPSSRRRRNASTFLSVARDNTERGLSSATATPPNHSFE